MRDHVGGVGRKQRIGGSREYHSCLRFLVNAPASKFVGGTKKRQTRLAKCTIQLLIKRSQA